MHRGIQFAGGFIEDKHLHVVYHLFGAFCLVHDLGLGTQTYRELTYLGIHLFREAEHVFLA